MRKKTNSDTPSLDKIDDKDTMRELKALASTREGQQLKKELENIDTGKLLEKFDQMDKELLKSKLKNINADTLRKAMQNKDFLNKLK